MKAAFGSNRRLQAFTLIELLIALALLGIILAAVVYVNIGTVRASATLQARNEMLADSQMAQNYMASKLKQAAYVYVQGASVVMATSGKTTLNPNGSYKWVIGTDPIVAFIMPPKSGINDPTATTSACPDTVTPATIDNDNCYYFYAFYAIKRSDLVADTGALTRTNNPGVDGLNDPTSWVIMEYRGRYQGTGYTLTGFTPGNTGRLLLDYVAPVAAPAQLFVTPAPVVGPQPVGTTSVTISLAVQRNVAGQIVQLPGVSTDTPTGRYTQTIYPRNVGLAPLSN
ncbi:prepilin-type N-terminal cleavage/methylation domain-containing protein [Deinococcus sp.]|uniref:prepilin-type N-terminal cleavage/methylation domain-containing protein n=1 Tax=Deinococcus sp. TaxID=47478 RepID=UPI003C79D6E9